MGYGWPSLPYSLTESYNSCVVMSPKNHHYLPQVYLRGFSLDKKKSKKQQQVFAFDRNSGGILPQFIEDICYEENLYQTEDANGNKETIIEEYYARGPENIFRHLVEQVEARNHLSHKDIADLAICIAEQLLRLPSSMKIMERINLHTLEEAANKEWAKLLDDEYRKEVMNEFKRHHPEFNQELSRQIVEDILEGRKIKVEYEIPKNNILRASRDLVEKLAASLLKMGWNFQFAPNGEKFITSDIPVFVMFKDGGKWHRIAYGGHNLPKAITVFPLNDHVCVSIVNTQYYQDFQTITKDAVRQMNVTIARQFDRFLISSSEELLHSFIPRP